MIAFGYTKTDGAEFLSHLDLLRHIDRTLRRAGIPVAKSEGYVKHPRIFLNNPLGLGVRSLAEYACVETDFTGDFKTLFNEHSPDGIKCFAYKVTDKNPNFAYTIDKCKYEVFGINDFDVSALLSAENIIITDLRGREVDIRPRIYSIERNLGKLEFVLGCGENNLRPDLFCSFLTEKFGGKAEGLIKTASYGESVF